MTNTMRYGSLLKKKNKNSIQNATCDDKFNMKTFWIRLLFIIALVAVIAFLVLGRTRVIAAVY